MKGPRRLAVAALVLAAVLGGAAASGAPIAAEDARPLTGCLDTSGALVAVAVGTDPSRACLTGEQTVTWGLPGPIGPQGLGGTTGPEGSSGAGRLSREVLASFDDMDADAPGWSERRRMDWSGGGDYVLWMPPDVVFGKTVSLPAHDTVRIQAQVDFYDQWRGEAAFLKVDGRVVWYQPHRNCLSSSPCNGISVGGDEQVRDELGGLLDVTVPHTDPTVTLQFGTTSRSQDEFELSLAIDDVTVSVGQQSGA